MKTKWFLRILVCVVLSSLSFTSSAFGELIAYASWSYGTNSKLWKIDLDTGAITVLGEGYPQTYVHIGISPADNNLYGVSSDPSGHTWEIDTTTGVFTSIWGPKNIAAVAFAPDGTLYTHGGARQKLSSYNLDAQTGGAFGNALPQTFPILAGLAINSQGQAIAGDNQKRLYSVNLTTGDFTSLGTVAGLPFSLRGLDYDDSDRLVAFFDTGLYSINVNSMSSTKLMSLTAPTGSSGGYQGQGIAFANVPEPSTLILLVTALTTGVLFRRRKH